MTDAFATRVARIIAGGAHALLDRAESLAPEAAKHLVVSQMAKLNAEHEKLSEQIDAALTRARDDLAEAAIGRQSDIEDLLPVLQKSLDEQADRSRELESYIVALLAKKRELDQLLIDYQASQNQQEISGASGGATDRQTRVEGASATFGRVLARQTGVSGLQIGADGDASKLKELADMQRGHRIAERLAALKAARGAT